MIDPKKKKNVIDKINDTSDENTEKRAVESRAKNDSLVASTRAKLFGKDVVDQRRAGNESANKTRKSGGVPQVKRFREGNQTEETEDKYSKPGLYGTRTADAYKRNAPTEKDSPRTTNSEMQNAMNFAGVKKKK